MTEIEFLHEMVKAAGGNPDMLKDKLKSTYYECLIDCMKNGGGGSGGSGGGGSIYAEITMSDGTTDNTARLYADVARSQMLTYEEAKEMFKSGAIICAPESGVDIFVTPLMVVPIEEIKVFQVSAFTGNTIIMLGAFCSDSVV